MAQPIPLELPARDPLVELQARLRNAPAQHAEALLAAYEVLQGLQDSGIFDLLRGALGSPDKLLEITVEAVRSPESIRALRNLSLVFKMLGAIEPDVLRTFAQATPQAMRLMVQNREPAGLGRLLKDYFLNSDFRRGMAAVNTMFEVFGRSLRIGNNVTESDRSPGLKEGA